MFFLVFSSSTDADGNITSFTYNELTSQLQTQTNPDGNVITYTYDSKGSVVKQAATSPIAPTQTQTWVYNVGGQLTSTTDANGIVTTYAYDAYGREASEQYTQSGATVKRDYTYDTDGNIKTLNISLNGTVRSYQAFFYNDSGTLSRVQESDYAQYVSVDQCVQYSYDLNGNVTQVTNGRSGGGYCQRYTYSPAGQVITENYYPSKTPYPSDSPAWWENYTYRLDGNMVSKFLSTPNTTATYAYDAFGRLSDEKYTNAGSPSSETVYTYDSRNNIVSAEYTGSAVPGAKTSDGSAYLANSWSQFSGPNVNPPPVHWLTSYTYDSANRLQSQITADVNNSNNVVHNISLTYDAAGNELTKTDSSLTTQNTSFTYDALNRTASFTSSKGTTNYTYDISNQRIGKSGATTLYSVWANGMIALDTTNPSAHANDMRYINLNGVNFGMVNSVNDAYTMRLTDAQGDTIGNTTALNSSSDTSTHYDAYGNQNNGPVQTAASNPYTYRGYYADLESNLYYLNNRMYDPSIQRFTQQDPAMDGSNWYAYCNGDAVNNVDPTGLSLKDEKDTVKATPPVVTPVIIPVVTPVDPVAPTDTTTTTDPSGNSIVGMSGVVYDRNKAIAYAKQYWNSFNMDYYFYGDDCTNFASQCLHAGGIPMTPDWHSYRGVPVSKPLDYLKAQIEAPYYFYKGCVQNFSYNWDVTSTWSTLSGFRVWITDSGLWSMAYAVNSFAGLMAYAKAGKLLPGDVAILDGGHHTVLIGQITSDNVYFFGHTNPRSGAPGGDYDGFRQFYNEAATRSIIIWHLYSKYDT